ncbi:unnamed protein product [Ceratitis capitata]|uniref:(Mediterranean fruit fly) hypothetical protein n=1 Tax=Ceratitis capitata TaxID=7213 RepID=A0A811UEB7_CERCA|nr:unnamed protein product [Ceratitis capitata]
MDLHANLNFSKGTIYAPYLNEIGVEEIIENLKEQKIDVSWYTVKVQTKSKTYVVQELSSSRPYKKRCNKPPVCDTCALPPHSPSPCKRSHCVNCLADHTSASCPKFTQLKEILTIQTDNNTTHINMNSESKENRQILANSTHSTHS